MEACLKACRIFIAHEVCRHSDHTSIVFYLGPVSGPVGQLGSLTFIMFVPVLNDWSV